MKVIIWILAVLGYFIWLPVVMVKDFAYWLTTPFDMQRYINTFTAFCRNAQTIECIIDPPEEPEAESKPQIGFHHMSQIDCKNLENPS